MDLPAHGDVTIGDVIRLSLPFGTMVSTGPGQMGRALNWAVTLANWQTAADEVQARDLVILPQALQEQTSPDELAGHIAVLADVPAAALVTFQEITPDVKRAALRLDFPVLVLPENTALRTVQRVITSLLLDRQTQTTERGMELYRQLSQMSLEARGLQAMAEMMCTVTGKIVVIQDKRLDIRAMAVPAGNGDANVGVDVNLVREALGQRDNLPAVLRNRKAAARARQSYWQQLLPIENVGRLLAPIVSGDRARGYVSVVGRAGDLDLLDSLTAEHGAAACALEMAKAKAVSEAEKKLRGDFLEGLLAGTLPQKEIERLEARLDHDTTQAHAVMTVAWDSPSPPSLRRLETSINWLLSSHNRPALLHIYAGDHVAVFQALRDGEDMSTAHELDRRLREHLQVEFGDARLLSGVSGPAMALADWPSVHQEALQAMQLGQRLNFNHMVEFNSLGIYQLLSHIEHLAPVQTFTQQIIGPLADYDRRHRGSLVETIDAYFKHHANVSQTAESLFIHRNTLLYRLERIQELTGQDIYQSDMRLALHLALKLWQLRPET